MSQNFLPFPGYTPSILVVDDDRSTRILLNAAMKADGYRVIQVTGGAEGLEEYRRSRPDMVLIDAVMPGMDGFTCCERLRSLPGGADVPILMVTVLDDRESVDRAFEAGATDFITKPIHWAVLSQRVKRLLHAYWATSELQRQLERERLLAEQLEATNQKLELANRRLRQLASLDGLTQIANRRYFNERAAQEWKRLTREQAPLSLIMVDVDFFKPYNDTYGHQAGDECLKRIAAVLQRHAKRPADLAARYGGEEFVLLLPNTNLQGAALIAERVRSEIEAMAIPHIGSLVSDVVTISLGVAIAVPNPGTSLKKLIAAADRALYRAKHEGRDRVVCSDEL